MSACFGMSTTCFSLGLVNVCPTLSRAVFGFFGFVSVSSNVQVEWGVGVWGSNAVVQCTVVIWGTVWRVDFVVEE